VVQRLFSTFPSGAPGAGLLLLRAAAGLAALWLGIESLSGQEEQALRVWLAVAGALASGLSLLLGLLTPGAGALAACLGVSLLLGGLPVAHGSHDLLLASLLIVVALAIVLLGPGAYSLDAYLFGRREIVIPDRGQHGQSGHGKHGQSGHGKHG
jgi:hypothetical protein